MSFSNFLERSLLDHVFGGVTYNPSGTLFVGLSTTTPNDDGTNFTEPAAASGYERVGVVNDLVRWNTAFGATATKNNKQTVVFPTATGPWGTLTYFGIFNGSGIGSGSGLGFGALTTPKSVAATDTAQFAASGITITLD